MDCRGCEGQEPPLERMENAVGGEDFGEEQTFRFGLAKFEMSFMYSVGDTK